MPAPASAAEYGAVIASVLNPLRGQTWIAVPCAEVSIHWPAH
jgi:hypothetical protein